MNLLQMSISGAVLIAVIAFTRLALLRAVPKRAFLVLWAVALARLLVPFAPVFEVPVSLPASSLPSGQAQQVDYTESAGYVEVPETPFETGASVAPVSDATAVEYASEAEFTPSAPATRDRASARGTSLWRVAWLVGMTLNSAVIAGLYLVNYRRFRRAVPVEDKTAQAWLGAHPLRRRLQIKTLGVIDSPLTYGVLRPVILVPEGFDFADSASHYALEHEYVHTRRFDAAFKLALAAALTVHWFNPAVVLMYFLANRDIELSCDEAVLRRFGETERGSYARALLTMEEKRSALPPVYAGFGANATKERIVSIMRYRKQSIFSMLLAAALVLSLAACAATTAKKQTAAPNSDEGAEPVGETPDTVVENGGVKLVIPGGYADLLLVETPQDSERGTLFSVSEKVSVEAGQLDHPGEDWGDGWLFSIARVGEDKLHEMQSSDMSGAEVFAKEGGNYYMYYHPTDVRLSRSGTPSDEDIEQWTELNEWAWNDVRDTFIAHNGLTPYTVTNTNVDIYLARLAYWDDIFYTLACLDFGGQLETGSVDKAPYVERLRNNVVFEWTDDRDAFNGEYVVLAFPDEGVRCDFMLGADGNYVRVLYGPNYEYENLYHATYADGTTKASEVMHDWCEALAGANRLTSELNALKDTLEYPEEDEPMTPNNEPMEPKWQVSNALQGAVEHFENDEPTEPQAETPAP